MKAVVAAFNQEKALVGAFSVITNLWMELFQALVAAVCSQSHNVNKKVDKLPSCFILVSVSGQWSQRKLEMVNIVFKVECNPH